MKKLLLILVAFICIVSGYPQTEKGRMFIGGSLSISGNSQTSKDSLTNNKYSTFGVLISPGFGYFIKNNFAIGGNLNFSINNSTQKDEHLNAVPYDFTKTTSKENTLLLGVAVYAQYYKKIVPNLFVFINGSIDYDHEARTEKYSNDDPNFVYSYYNPAVIHYQDNDIGVYISPGLLYFITPKLGIHTSFGNLYYRYSMSKNTTFTYDQSNSSTFGLNVKSSSFSFGMNYYFR